MEIIGGVGVHKKINTQDNSQYYDHHEPKKIIRPSDNTWGVLHLQWGTEEIKRDTIALEGLHRGCILIVPYRAA